MNISSDPVYGMNPPHLIRKEYQTTFFLTRFMRAPPCAKAMVAPQIAPITRSVLIIPLPVQLIGYEKDLPMFENPEG